MLQNRQVRSEDAHGFDHWPKFFAAIKIPTLALFVLVFGLSFAEAGTNRFPFFAWDRTLRGRIRLPGLTYIYILDQEKIVEAMHTQECQPAEDDPLGNWGAVTNGLQASIRFAKKSYGTNEPVVATFIARNHSMDWRILAFGFGLQSELALVDPSGHRLERKDWLNTNTWEGRLQRISHRIIRYSVEPGAQVKMELDLRQWFEINTPGEYTVHTLLSALQWGNARTNDTIISGDATFRITTVAKEDFPIELSCKPVNEGGHFKAGQPVTFLISMKNVSKENFELYETNPRRDFRYTVCGIYNAFDTLKPKIYSLLDREMNQANAVTLKPGDSREFQVDLAQLYDFPLSIGQKIVVRRAIWQGGKKYGEAESNPVEFGVER